MNKLSFLTLTISNLIKRCMKRSLTFIDIALYECSILLNLPLFRFLYR